MLRRLIRNITLRLVRCAVETPRGHFGHVGQNALLGPFISATFPERVFIGNDTYIGPHAFLSSQGGLTIEDGTVIGPYFTCYTANHQYELAEAVPYGAAVLLQPVTIRRNSWIGGNVVVVPGVTVGEGAVVAAGAVVTKDVPDLTVVGGNPARPLKCREADHYWDLVSGGKIYMRLRAEQRLVPREVVPGKTTKGPIS